LLKLLLICRISYRIFRNIVLVSFCICYFFQSIYFAQNNVIAQEELGVTFDTYKPEVIGVRASPAYPSPDSEVNIAARVIDRYGQIQNATLLYSIDNGTTYKNITMKLINGSPSNGTYLGVVPSIAKVNHTVLYQLLFRDNLGYMYYSDNHYSDMARAADSSYDSYTLTEYSNRAVAIYFEKDNVPGKYLITDHMILAQSTPFHPIAGEPIPIIVMIKDYGRTEEELNKKNVTLFYSNVTANENNDYACRENNFYKSIIILIWPKSVPFLSLIF
jgi:hypothetical protein